VASAVVWQLNYYNGKNRLKRGFLNAWAISSIFKDVDVALSRDFLGIVSGRASFFSFAQTPTTLSTL
jgi:hypothetical protein